MESGLGVITASLVGPGNTCSIFAFDRRRQDSLVLNVTVTVRPSAGLSFMDGFVTEESAYWWEPGSNSSVNSVQVAGGAATTQFAIMSDRPLNTLSPQDQARLVPDGTAVTLYSFYTDSRRIEAIGSITFTIRQQTLSLLQSQPTTSLSP